MSLKQNLCNFVIFIFVLYFTKLFLFYQKFIIYYTRNFKSESPHTPNYYWKYYLYMISFKKNDWLNILSLEGVRHKLELLLKINPNFMTIFSDLIFKTLFHKKIIYNIFKELNSFCKFRFKVCQCSNLSYNKDSAILIGYYDIFIDCQLIENTKFYLNLNYLNNNLFHLSPKVHPLYMYE